MIDEKENFNLISSESVQFDFQNMENIGMERTKPFVVSDRAMFFI